MKAAIKVAKMEQQSMLVIKTGHAQYPKSILKRRWMASLVVRGWSWGGSVSALVLNLWPLATDTTPRKFYTLSLQSAQAEQARAQRTKWSSTAIMAMISIVMLRTLLFFCGTSSILTVFTSIIRWGNIVLLWRNAGWPVMGGFFYGPLSWGWPSLTHGSCIAT